MEKLHLLKVVTIVFAFCAATAIASSAQTFTSLVSFDGADGAVPEYSSPVQGTNGDLYGTTNEGGANDAGTIFQITPAGTLTTLYSFCTQPNCSDGEYPTAGLILATNGDLYGTTQRGGIGGGGTVFKITTSGTLTTLYSFDGTDGLEPTGLVQATNGDFYGTTEYAGANGLGIVFKITTSGKLTTLHSFDGIDGERPYGAMVQATNGDLYGTTIYGGTNNDGAVFEITTGGEFTTLYSFCTQAGCADGEYPTAGLVQATNGDFYGTTSSGGTVGDGTVFKITSAGELTTLHSFEGTDGQLVYATLVQATNGDLYGTTIYGGTNNDGTVFEITTAGELTTLYNFCTQAKCADGIFPSALVQATNGDFYGTTELGGANDDGTIFSLDLGIAPFVILQSASGTVGSTVGILGQDFSESSVVKFNGVDATKIVLSGTTYITATVPAGATDGKVTVTTGTTTLTSTQTFIVHNTWSKGAAVPVAVAGPATGVISGKIYVVSGIKTYGDAPVNNNQVYNPSTNTWTTAATIPTPVFEPASAVVGGSLYVIGGGEGSSYTQSNLVQIYNPTTNKWTTGAAMPTARTNDAAAVDDSSIYVIGGNGSTARLATVEKYVPSTNKWTEEAPLLTGVSDLSAGLLGSTIVAADGYTTSGDEGTTEGYDVSTNKWISLTSDPKPRNDSCYGVVSGLLYLASGIFADPSITDALTVNESFSATTNKWTTLTAIPTATFESGSAVDNGQLYCFGGEASFRGTVINNVQIYQP
jgi:uncharacterized repeat protein (TIGR03803 family)